jgi:hypothetical protein
MLSHDALPLVLILEFGEISVNVSQRGYRSVRVGKIARAPASFAFTFIIHHPERTLWRSIGNGFDLLTFPHPPFFSSRRPF